MHDDIPNHDRHFDPPDDDACPECYPEEGGRGELCRKHEADARGDALDAQFMQRREEQAGIC